VIDASSGPTLRFTQSGVTCEERTVQVYSASASPQMFRIRQVQYLAYFVDEQIRVSTDHWLNKVTAPLKMSRAYIMLGSGLTKYEKAALRPCKSKKVHLIDSNIHGGFSYKETFRICGELSLEEGIFASLVWGRIETCRNIIPRKANPLCHHATLAYAEALQSLNHCAACEKWSRHQISAYSRKPRVIPKSYRPM
jgi:hypothetical protein